ncbi:MAG: hypothetical protein C4545_07895 [Anaerolineaceae bacterium]|jgi:hypothetical protein|nr:MAG: hypothetical protein C4545_07895 [Anaerolineaceae bacterium]
MLIFLSVPFSILVLKEEGRVVLRTLPRSANRKHSFAINTSVSFHSFFNHSMEKPMLNTIPAIKKEITDDSL